MSCSKLLVLKFRSFGFLPHDSDAFLVHNLLPEGFRQTKLQRVSKQRQYCKVVTVPTTSAPCPSSPFNH